eukprot:3499454-Pleurochrysis_carterae.AAC.1
MRSTCTSELFGAIVSSDKTKCFITGTLAKREGDGSAHATTIRDQLHKKGNMTLASYERRPYRGYSCKTQLQILSTSRRNSATP